MFLRIRRFSPLTKNVTSSIGRTLELNKSSKTYNVIVMLRYKNYKHHSLYLNFSPRAISVPSDIHSTQQFGRLLPR